MKTISSLLFLVIIPLTNGYSQHNQNVTRLLATADSLRDQYQEPAALNQYLTVLRIDSTNYKALWSASFLYSRIGNRFNNKNQQIDYFKKARQLALQALDVDSTDAQSNWVMSVALGRIALISGAKRRVSLAKDIKFYAEKALKYDSHHDGAWYVLGKWNFRVANLSFAERMAANLLFGGIPAGASNQKAIEDYQKAIQYGGDKLLYWLDLARAYHETGEKAKEKETLRKLLRLPVKSPDDPQYAAEAQKMLGDLD